MNDFLLTHDATLFLLRFGMALVGVYCCLASGRRSRVALLLMLVVAVLGLRFIGQVVLRGLDAPGAAFADLLSVPLILLNTAPMIWVLVALPQDLEEGSGRLKSRLLKGRMAAGLVASIGLIFPVLMIADGSAGVASFRWSWDSWTIGVGPIRRLLGVVSVLPMLWLLGTMIWSVRKSPSGSRRHALLLVLAFLVFASIAGVENLTDRLAGAFGPALATGVLGLGVLAVCHVAVRREGGAVARPLLWVLAAVVLATVGSELSMRSAASFKAAESARRSQVAAGIARGNKVPSEVLYVLRYNPLTQTGAFVHKTKNVPRQVSAFEYAARRRLFRRAVEGLSKDSPVPLGDRLDQLLKKAGAPTHLQGYATLLAGKKGDSAAALTRLMDSVVPGLLSQRTAILDLKPGPTFRSALGAYLEKQTASPQVQVFLKALEGHIGKSKAGGAALKAEAVEFLTPIPPLPGTVRSGTAVAEAAVRTIGWIAFGERGSAFEVGFSYRSYRAAQHRVFRTLAWFGVGLTVLLLIAVHFSRSKEAHGTAGQRSRPGDSPPDAQTVNERMDTAAATDVGFSSSAATTTTELSGEAADFSGILETVRREKTAKCMHHGQELSFRYREGGDNEANRLVISLSPDEALSGGLSIRRMGGVMALFRALQLYRHIATGNSAFDREHIIVSPTTNFARAYVADSAKVSAMRVLLEIADTLDVTPQVLTVTIMNPSFSSGALRDWPADLQKIADNLLSLGHRVPGGVVETTPDEQTPRQLLMARFRFFAVLGLPVAGLLISGIAMIVANSYPVHDGWGLFLFSLRFSFPIWIACLVIGWLALRGRDNILIEPFFVLAATFFAFPLTYLSAKYVNGAFDQSPPITADWDIAAKRHKASSDSETFSISVQRMVNGRTMAMDLDIRRKLYQALKANQDRVQLTTRAGRLGFVWRVSVRKAPELP